MSRVSRSVSVEVPKEDAVRSRPVAVVVLSWLVERVVVDNDGVCKRAVCKKDVLREDVMRDEAAREEV